MPERERIAQFFAPLTAGEPGSFNLRDDAAILTPPAQQTLVVTTDSVIEGIHVLPGASPEQFARKLMRRNLSDLAAMGATPWRYLLNLHTSPACTDRWVAEFAATLAEEQATFGLTLIGGDSTASAGPIHTTLTCMGLLAHAPLRRSGAQAGDDIYVSGTIGDAALGLFLLQQNAAAISPLVARYHTPIPRLALGHALLHYASAAIDISDGLLADISQLCRASSVGVVLEQSLIPLSPEATTMLTTHPAQDIWNKILNGGDDYELCFTAPQSQRETLIALSTQLTVPLTRIGTLSASPEMRLNTRDGNTVPLTETGWEY